MSEPVKLRVSELDFNEIKNNFKEFLKVQDEFKDYNVEGSVISMLLDVLAYNTHYNSFYLNMIANEMFLDTAVNRSSLISISKQLGYLPQSRVGSRANVNISVTPNDSPSNVTIAKNTKFNSNINGVNYVFVTDKAYSVEANNNQTVSLNNVTLIEGEPLTFRYTVDESDDTQRFVIPNRGVDHSTVTVKIQESQFNTNQSVYSLASDLLTVNSSSNVYFVEETTDCRTEIIFGDGVLGNKVKTGNLVIIDYNACSGVLGNGAEIFSVATTAGGYSSVTLTTNESAKGGSDEETINSIRFNAPRNFDTQNRAVTKDDYKRIILRDYPLAESVIVYGGEDADPPQYGKVFCSIKPKQGLNITSAVKNQIRDTILKKYNVASITPEFVDLTYLHICPSITVNYDSRTSTQTAESLKTKIEQNIIKFSTNKIEEFDQQFRISAFQREIDDTDTSIVGNEVDLKIKKRFIPTLSTNLDYTFNFYNEISHPHDDHPATVTSTNFSIKDSADIIRENCFLEDFNGVMRITRMNGNVRVIVNANAGTVNYKTGKVELNSFNPITFQGNEMLISVTPRFSDIKTDKQQLLIVEKRDLYINMIDISATISGDARNRSTSTTPTTTTSTTTTSSVSTTGY